MHTSNYCSTPLRTFTASARDAWCSSALVAASLVWPGRFCAWIDDLFRFTPEGNDASHGKTTLRSVGPCLLRVVDPRGAFYGRAAATGPVRRPQTRGVHPRSAPFRRTSRQRLEHRHLPRWTPGRIWQL